MQKHSVTFIMLMCRVSVVTVVFIKVAVHVCSLIIHELQAKKIMRTLYQDETRYNGAKTSNRGAKDCSSAAILKLSSDVKWLGSSDHKAHR